jgi:hypothetical protein
MRKLLLLTGIVLSLSCASQAGFFNSDVVPGQLRCEYRENPLSIDSEKTRLSWKLETRSTFAKASAYANTLPADKTADKNLTMDVTIPINTTATVYVPAKDAAGVTESGTLATKANGVKFLRIDNGAAVYEGGSGTYRFQSSLPETVKQNAKQEEKNK